jgi:hypothetical protein
LPWKSVNENILQLSQPNKGCGNEAPSVIVNKNKELQRISRNICHQKTEVNAECVYEVPLVTTVECFSLRKTVKCQKHGNSVASVDFQSETGVGCAVKTSKVKADSQEVDHVGKPTRVNDNSQQDATTHKSTGTKKFPTFRIQDPLW